MTFATRLSWRSLLEWHVHDIIRIAAHKFEDSSFLGITDEKAKMLAPTLLCPIINITGRSFRTVHPMPRWVLLSLRFVFTLTISDSATIDDHDLAGRGTILRAYRLDSLDELGALDNLATVS